MQSRTVAIAQQHCQQHWIVVLFAFVMHLSVELDVVTSVDVKLSQLNAGLRQQLSDTMATTDATTTAGWINII